MNKKVLKITTLTIIMIIAVLALTGCANPLNKEGNSKNDLEGLAVWSSEGIDYSDYTKCDKMSGIEFYYPSNYTSVGKSTQPMYMDPDILGASVNLVSSDMSKAMTFEGYIDASIAGIKRQMSIQGDVSKEYINLNGVKAAKLEYTATSEGQTAKLTQVAIVKNSKVYILTLGGLATDAEALQPKIEKMIKSFK